MQHEDSPSNGRVIFISHPMEGGKRAEGWGLRAEGRTERGDGRKAKPLRSDFMFFCSPFFCLLPSFVSLVPFVATKLDCQERPEVRKDSSCDFGEVMRFVSLFDGSQIPVFHPGYNVAD
jgi:hypothetical protein